MRIWAAVSVLLCVFAASAAAAPRCRVSTGVLAPGHDLVLVAAGLRPGSRSPVNVEVAGRRVRVGVARASRTGRARVVIHHAGAVAVAVSNSIGVVLGTVVVAGQRLPVSVLGVVLDPMSLAVVPDAPVGYDEALTLRVSGLAITGPPVGLGFSDCEGAPHTVTVARPAVAGPVSVVLAAHAGARGAVDATCFAHLGLEVAQIDFTIGETVAGTYRAVGTATAAFLPPTGT